MRVPYKLLSTNIAPLFSQLDESEQVFLVLLMRLLNEVNILSKAVLLTNGGIEHLHGPVQTAQRVQGLFYLRELAGKLWEGWQLLQRSYFSARMSERYDNELLPEGQEALRSIKDYFGRPANPLKLVRDKHAFHYDGCTVKRELAQMPGNEPLLAYVAEERVNCLFVFADDIASRSVLRSFDNNEKAAMSRLIDEVAVRVPAWFQDFGGALVMAMLVQHGTPDSNTEDVKDAPALSEVWLPFFMRRGS